jgi:hypothetical protein
MIPRIATGADLVREIPIKGVSPIGGEQRWYLDGDAPRSWTRHAAASDPCAPVADCLARCMDLSASRAAAPSPELVAQTPPMFN